LTDYNSGLAVHFGDRISDGNSVSETDGLVGYWNFEEGSGQTVYDRSGNGNSGTLGASTAVGKDDPVFTPGHDSNGPGGTGLQFDGVDDYVEVSDSDSLDVNGNLTITAWIYPNSLPIEASILSKGGSTSCGNYDLYIYNGKLALLSTSSCNWDYRGTNSDVTVGTWQHIAAVWDGTNVAYYINGMH
jgi:hypothetical protein